MFYDQFYNTSSEIRKDEDACLAMTGEPHGTSKEKLYHELGLESLENRRWFWKLLFFFKIFEK